MTRASYFDPKTDALVEVPNVDAPALAQLLERVRRLTSSRGIPAVEVVRPDAASLSFGTDGERACLVWVHADGTSFHSFGGSATDPVLVYDYMGSWTEVPGSFTVPIPSAHSAMVSFLDGGSPDVAVDFEHD